LQSFFLFFILKLEILLIAWQKKFFLHFIINEGTSEEGHKNPPLIIKKKVKNKSLTFKEENLKKV